MTKQRENNLLKTVGKSKEKTLEEYLAKVDSKQPVTSDSSEDKKNRSKVQSISVYNEDSDKLKLLSRFIQNETDSVDVSLSKLYRACLHYAKCESDFIEIYKKM